MARNLLQNNKIFIAGHSGMVGSALVKYLKKKNFKNFILVTKKQINLLDENKVNKFIKKKKTTNYYQLRWKSRRNISKLNLSSRISK